MILSLINIKTNLYILRPLNSNGIIIITDTNGFHFSIKVKTCPLYFCDTVVFFEGMKIEGESVKKGMGLKNLFKKFKFVHMSKIDIHKNYELFIAYFCS